MSSETATLSAEIQTQADASGFDEVIEKAKETQQALDALAASGEKTNQSLGAGAAGGGIGGNVSSLQAVQQGYKGIGDSATEAGGAIAQFNGNMTEGTGGIQDATKNFDMYSMSAEKSGEATKQMGASTKDSLLAFTELGAGIMGIVGTFTSLERAALMVDRANKAVASSTEAARKAQDDYNSMLALSQDYSAETARRAQRLAAANAELARVQSSGVASAQELNKAIQEQKDAQIAYDEAIKGGIPSAEALQAAHNKLDIANQNVAISTERASIAETRQQEAFGEAALGIASTVINLGSGIAQMGTAIAGARAGFTAAKGAITDFGILAKYGGVAAEESGGSISRLGQIALVAGPALATLGPIALAVGAGIGTFFALTAAYESNFMGFRGWADAAAQGLQNFGGAIQIAFEYLKAGDFAGAFKTMGVAINDAMGFILSSIDNLMGNIPSKILGYLQDAASQAGAAAAGIGKAIQDGIAGFMTQAIDFGKWILTGLSNAVDSASKGAAAIATAIWNTLQETGGKVLDFGKWIFDGLSGAVDSAVKGAAAISTAIQNTLMQTGAKALDFGKWILDGLSKALDSAAKGAAAIATAIYNNISAVTTKALDFGSWILGGLSNALGDAVKGAQAIGTAIFNTITAALKPLNEAIKNALPKESTAIAGTGPAGALAGGALEKNLEALNSQQDLINKWAANSAKMAQLPPPVDTSKAQVGSPQRPFADTAAMMGAAGGQLQNVAFQVPQGMQQMPALYTQIADSQNQYAASTGKAKDAVQEQNAQLIDNANWLSSLKNNLTNYSDSEKNAGDMQMKSNQQLLDEKTGRQQVALELAKQDQATRQMQASNDMMLDSMVRTRMEHSAYSAGAAQAANELVKLGAANANTMGQVQGYRSNLENARFQQDLFTKGVNDQQLAEVKQAMALQTSKGAYQEYHREVANGQLTTLAYQEGQVKQARALDEAKVALAGTAGELSNYAYQVQSGEQQSVAFQRGQLGMAKTILDNKVAVAEQAGGLSVLDKALQQGIVQQTAFGEGTNKATQEMLGMEEESARSAGYLSQMAAWLGTARGKADEFAAGALKVADGIVKADAAFEQNTGTIAANNVALQEGVLQTQAFGKGWQEQTIKDQEAQAALFEHMGTILQYSAQLKTAATQNTIFGEGMLSVVDAENTAIAETIKLQGATQQLAATQQTGQRAIVEFNRGYSEAVNTVAEMDDTISRSNGEWMGMRDSLLAVIDANGGAAAAFGATNEQLKQMAELARGSAEAMSKVVDEMNKAGIDVAKGLTKGLQDGKKGFRQALDDLEKDTGLTFSPQVRFDLKQAAGLQQLHDQIEKSIGVITLTMAAGDVPGTLNTIDQMIQNIGSHMDTAWGQQRFGPVISSLSALKQAYVDAGGALDNNVIAKMGMANIAIANSELPLGNFNNQLAAGKGYMQQYGQSLENLNGMLQANNLHLGESGQILTAQGVQISTLKDYYQSLGDTVQANGDVLDANGQKVTNIGTAAAGASPEVQKLNDTLSAVGQSNVAWASMAQTAQNAFANISENINALSEGLAGSFIAAVAGANTAFASLAQTAQQAFMQIYQSVTALSEGLAGSFLGAVAAANTVFASMAQTGNNAFAIIAKGALTIATGINSAFSRAQGDANGYLNSIASTATSIFARIGTSATSAATGINNAFRRAQGDAQGYLNSIVSAATSAFGAVASAASSRLSAIPGMFSRIQSSANSATASVRQLAAAINALHDKTITITTVYRTVGGGGGGGYFQAGYEGVISTPTTIHVAEAGPERVVITPLSAAGTDKRSGKAGMGTGGTIIKQPLQLEISTTMNGKELARQLANYELDISAEL